MRTFVFWVINHWWFPVSVHIVIPVVGFFRIGIGDVFWLFPIVGLGVVGIGDFFAFIPF